MLQTPYAQFAKKTKDSKKEKKQAEKASVRSEFEGKELDDLKKSYSEDLDSCIELLEDALDAIKSGRASPQIFNGIEVKAYGEMCAFEDVAVTSVQGNNNLTVKVFDESVKDEVLKALQRSDFDLSIATEGKDIRVKMGTSRKEHIAEGLKKTKVAHESFKKNAREARAGAMATIKKLSKIIPQEQVKVIEDEFEKLLSKYESQAQQLIDAKSKDLNQ